MPNCTDKRQMNHVSPPKDVISSASMPCPVEESTCSLKTPIFIRDDGIDFRVSGGASASATKSIASSSKVDKTQISSSFLQRQNSASFDPPAEGHFGFIYLVSIDDFLAFKIGEGMIYVDVSSCMQDGKLCIEDLKVEVACVYFLQLSGERRVRGLLPVIGQLKCCAKELEPCLSIEDVQSSISEQKCIKLFITAWVPKRLMKLYVDCCIKIAEAPNVKLLKKLYSLEA